jgi:hypothetical protein
MALKSPEAVLRTALIGNADVQALIAGRIYPLRYVGPQPVAFPITIWRRSGIIREQTLSGPMGVPKLTVEFHHYATTYETARDLADKARKVLDGYGGTVDNVEVKQVALADEADDLVEQEGAETSIYVVRQSYEIWWQET